MKAKLKATKTRKPGARSESVEPSSGNVFADLGFQDAEIKSRPLHIAVFTPYLQYRARPLLLPIFAGCASL
jgi:hypothetical protein